MTKITYILRPALLLLCLHLLPLLGMAQSAHKPLGHLLPQPASVRYGQGSFSLKGGITLEGDAEFTALSAVDRFLGHTQLRRHSSASRKLSLERVQRLAVGHQHDLPHFADETYRISIDRHAVRLQATNRVGIIRGLQTLTQLTYDYPKALPSLTIEDWPAFKVRGFMHDIGRSYISVEELKRQIDMLASCKVNVFLWHLSDIHGFRFESKAHPEVNTNFTPTRSDRYYTQEECREIQDYAWERGMTIIPEIDMPGHSRRFEGATGYTMASQGGKRILKVVLKELAETFDKAEYIHIGGDETAEATPEYINEMADHVRSLGRKVVVWNCYKHPLTLVDKDVIHCDMVTNWATAGRLAKGLPNVDMRYNYINHFDMFADVAGIYRSTILYEQKGTPEVAGTITGIWNDRLISDEKQIVRQNNLYANTLASAERAWRGGGAQYIEEGGAYLPNSGAEYEEFKDWERRFLFHKATSLKAVAEDIPYVRQTNVHWHISPAYDNGGDESKAFAPELESELKPSEDGLMVTGAGIWLNHIWAGIVEGVLGSKQAHNQTRYAWTYVYSPRAQEVGAFIQTYDYSRSDRGVAPPDGKWDMMGSRVWVNDTELFPPAPYTTKPQPEGYDSEESELGNVNFTSRPPIAVRLNKGWNKVLLKLPYVRKSPNRTNKWQFTFVFTTPNGRQAMPNLVYSPSKER